MTNTLKNRLGTLRRQTGTAPAPQPREPSIAELMQRYRVGPRASTSASTPRITPKELAALLEGELIDAGVIRIERRIGLDKHHGDMPLSRLLDDHAALPEAAGLDPRALVFLDTETSGLAGGTGTIAFMLGLARIEGDELVVRQYQLTGFAGEAPMLEDADTWLREGDALVTFNGKCFDVPLLSTRARLAGVRDRCAAMVHLDLLHPTRRAFARRWPDCRLATAERDLIGFRRHDDLPGSEAPLAWFDYLHRGHAGRLSGVARHNHWDLVSLAVLLPALAAAHDCPAVMGADVLAVARAHLVRDDEDRALELLLEAADELDEDAALELARLHRRRNEWPQACALWERLAGQGSIEAIERLAKYYEHERSDWAVALRYACMLPGGGDYEHRRQRLQGKLDRQGASLLP